LRREVGEIVTPADHVLLVLADLQTLIVRLNLDYKGSDALAIGSEVGGRCAEHSVSATVARTAPVIDAATGTREVELELVNSDGRLLAGMACEFDL